jgi:hypothetical protein
VVSRLFLVVGLLSGCTLLVGDPDPKDLVLNYDLSVPHHDLAKGSCGDVTSDVHNCGSCGHDCTHISGADPLKVSCTNGVCDLTNACVAGRGDCMNGADDGCETDLTTSAHCGSCTNACSTSLPLCMQDTSGQYACTPSCTSSAPTICGSSCVNTYSDPNHCNSCTTVCPGDTHGTPICQSGICSISCYSGYHLCTGACVDNTSLQSCGYSCTPCPAPPTHGYEICTVSGYCDFTCNFGYTRSGSSCIPTPDMAHSPDLL